MFITKYVNAVYGQFIGYFASWLDNGMAVDMPHDKNYKNGARPISNIFRLFIADKSG